MRQPDMQRRRQIGRVVLGTLAACLVLVGCSASTGASGSPVPGATAVASRSPAPQPSASTSTTTGIRGKATAGPVCPVERIPPESGCAPRPVVGAVIVISSASGKEVARATTASDGGYHVSLPAGTYTVTPEGTAGMMRAPGPQSVTVGDGMATLDLAYDTGIR
jgi:hypothetical protein